MENQSITCLLKKLYIGQKFESNSIQEGLSSNEGIGINDQTKFEKTKNLHLGRFYASVSRHFDYDQEEGKFMGLQSYGNLNENLLEKLNQGIDENDLEKIVVNKDNAHTSQIFFENLF